MSKFKVNLRGDMFAAMATFAAAGVIKLGSSVILTRVLTPKAYGIFAILMSIGYILVMLSDVGFNISIVRSPRGAEQSYLNTAWTIRVIRGFINAGALLIGGPIAARLYHAPVLAAPLEVMSLWLLIDGFESTSFPLATREKKSRIRMYAELWANLISTIFTVIYCYFTHSFWGMVYGLILNRLAVVVLSHLYYREKSPRLQWDREAAREIFGFSRFVMPSSTVSLVVNQYDRAVFLRLFDFNLLGVYSLAGNITSSIESLLGTISRSVLYARCAHNYREDPSTYPIRYYRENIRAFACILGIPAAIGGAAHFIISAVYDPRYIGAAVVLQAFMLRATLKALGQPAEEMLIASGESRLYLIGNVYRAIWLPVASLAGYHFYGFMGFTLGVTTADLPPLLYYWWLQKRRGFLVARYEGYKIAFSVAVAAAAWLTSSVLALMLPGLRIKL